jgi:hypothetical protein
MPFPAKVAATERQDIAATVELLTALIFLLSGRVTEVEESNREMRARLGMDAPPPTIGPDWLSLKQAAHATGLSVSGLWWRYRSSLPNMPEAIATFLRLRG